MCPSHKVSHTTSSLQLITLHAYLFTDGTYKTLMLLGDQLTVERARAAQRARVASDTNEDALNGLEPAAADWHAEANFLQVVTRRYSKKIPRATKLIQG